MQGTFRVLSPTGHLGFTPLERASFEAGMAIRPDAVAADSGSNDIGPHALGADVAHSPREWQYADVEALLTATRHAGIPLVIGSCSDTGTRRGVDDFLAMVREIAARHRLAPFRAATVYADVAHERVAAAVARGEVAGLDGLPALDGATLAATSRMVAMMGPEPIMAALAQGADVVLAGRSCDDAIFAALALRAGCSRADAALLGKTLECASLCAEPFKAKESVIGTVDASGVTFEPLHPDQRCTPHSVAGHCLYERTDPYLQAGPGGTLDLRACAFTALDARRTRVTGARFIPDSAYRVKLEGAARLGERALTLMGLRDPLVLANLDAVVAFARRRVAERYGGACELHFHAYGRDAVMGAREADRRPPHEVGLLIEAVAETAAQAGAVVQLAARNLFFAQFPGQKATAGAAAFVCDEVLAARPAYRWSVDHLLPVADPCELFPVALHTVRGEEVSP